MPCWILERKTHRFIAVNASCRSLFGYNEAYFLDELTIDHLLKSSNIDQQNNAVRLFVDIQGAIIELYVIEQPGKFNGIDCIMSIGILPLALADGMSCTFNSAYS